MTASKLPTNILSTPDIEGITLVSGEPFAQADACTALATKWDTSRNTVELRMTSKQVHINSFPVGDLTALAAASPTPSS